MQQGDYVMLKVSCISSLKWQLNDSMTKQDALGVQTSAPTLGPGRVWERKKHFGKINITPKTVFIW